MKYLKRFNEDVYYEPRYRDKTPREIEDEIEPLVKEWIDEQVGEEISRCNVMQGGSQIMCGVDRKKVERDRVSRRELSDDQKKESEKASKAEWRESAPELIDQLERAGYGVYELSTVTKWGLTLWRNDESSGGPLKIQVRVPGF